MLIFHRLQEIPEIWTSKMSDGTKTSEQTFSGYLLEMSLTDVLYRENKITCIIVLHEQGIDKLSPIDTR